MKSMAIYSRKSKFTGKGESIENQIELCKEYIKTHYGNDATIEVYEDEGFSGGNADRPKFKKLMADAKQRKFDVLVCYRLDRVSRNIADFAFLIETLNSLGIAFVSIRETFDTNTPMGRAMMFIASVFAQLERETIAERIRDNMTELAKTGRWLGGVTPTGYKSEGYTKITIDGKIKKAYKLVPVDEEKEIVKLLFNKYLELGSQTALETYLIQSNIKTKNSKAYTRFAIRGILENPVYAIADRDMYSYYMNKNIDIYAGKEDFDGTSGIMAYNKTIQKKSKTNKPRDISEWIISTGLHEGFITGRDWIKAQEILEKNVDKRYRKPRMNNSLLTGLVRCGECGSLMRPKIYRTKESENGPRFSYMCEMKDKSRMKNCKAKNVSGNELDKQVIEAVKITVVPENNIYHELKELSTLFGSEENKAKKELNMLKNLLSKNKQEIDSLVNKLKYVDDDMVGEITAEIRRLKNANANIEEDIGNMTTSGSAADKGTADLLLHIPENYFNVLDSLDTLQKRSMLRSILKDVTVKDDGVVINFLGTGEVSSFPLSDYCK